VVEILKNLDLSSVCGTSEHYPTATPSGSRNRQPLGVLLNRLLCLLKERFYEVSSQMSLKTYLLALSDRAGD